NGFVAMNLERNGFKTVLVEQGNIGVINAGKRELPNIICSTLEDADFKQESISAIGLFDVLEHIKEDLDFLKCIRNVLIKKGRFYLTVPAFNYLWSEEDNLSGHYRRYSKNSISDLLITVGFKIEYCSYNFLFLPVPIFLLRALLYKLGFRMKEKVIENATKAHRPVNKFVSNMIEKFLNFELGWIKMKKSIPFGGSIIIVAAKE
ncbi:MAG: methyltransferase domain-containing protein, partial [Bacteroidetes bacterium]